MHTVLEEDYQVSVQIDDAELRQSPWLDREPCIGMDKIFPLPAFVQLLDSADTNPAGGQLGDRAIVALPEMNLDIVALDNAEVGLLMPAGEAELGFVEGEALRDVERCKHGDRGEEHGCDCMIEV